MTFTLERAPGLGDELIVRILADDLTRQIWLEPHNGESDRDFKIRAFQFRIGGREQGMPGIQWAPLRALDHEEPEAIVNEALRAHGLDPESCTWDDIVTVAL